MNLVKQRSYMIRRENRDFWVHPTQKGLKVLPVVGGGATTAPTPSSQAQTSASVVAEFLKSAPTKDYSIVGTVPSGSAGGSTSNVTWQQDIPITPAICEAIEYDVTLPISLTLPATTGTATVSQFAPYSVLANLFTLAGSPPWPFTELTPWHIDDTMHHINYAPDYPGLGNNAGYYATLLDQGPLAINLDGITPGIVLTNTTSAAVTTNYTLQFKAVIKLRRKRHLLWGAVPLGDPENRPLNTTQIYPFIGTRPEQSLFVNVSAGATCVTNGLTTVIATYKNKYIDLLYPGMSQAPQPAISMGLQLTADTIGNLSAGAIRVITHRTAMIYTAIHEILVNDQAAIRPDYWALWDDQDQQSARWAYDAQVNNLQNYWRDYHKVYRRYPIVGQMSVDMENGVFPEIPSVTPYDALMSPDKGYAASFRVPVTPAMSTAIRIPSTVTVNNPYVRNYSLGLVSVNY